MSKRSLTKGKTVSFRPSEANRAFLQEARSKGLTHTEVVEAGLNFLRETTGLPIVLALSDKRT